MKITKTRLRIHRLMLSWTAVVGLLWIPVACVLGSIWHSGPLTILAAIAPMLITVVKPHEHYYLMKRNVDFDQYRIK